MNIAKNMELIFVAALAVVSMTGFATASDDTRKLAAPEVVKVGAVSDVMVITVTGKRLTAAEKAQLAD
jgi:hypothetical protein